jgi:hypothetical protein
MNSSNELKLPKLQLSPRQQALVGPAVRCIQLGISIYLSEHLKPYMFPLLMLSLVIIAVIGLQAFKDHHCG